MRIKLGYFIREAVASFRRNWVMSIAAVSTVAISLIMLGVFVLIALTLNNLIRGMERKVEIITYLKSAAPTAAVDKLQRDIVSWEEVTKVSYVSKKEAWERLKKDLKDQPEMLDAVRTNPLPASLEIKLKDPHQVKQVAGRLEGRPEIDEVKYGQEIVPKLFAVFSMVRVIGIVFISLLSFAAVVLIANTIRLSIYARRKEIGIMKLVGASNWFIRWPFLLEGIFQGIIGAVTAAVVLYLAYLGFLKAAQQVLPFLPITLSPALFLNLVLYLALGGIGIGALASSIAIWRFLRV